MIGCYVHSFVVDLTGVRRQLEKDNKITRENTRATMKAATVKRKPVYRYVLMLVECVHYIRFALERSLFVIIFYTESFFETKGLPFHPHLQVARKKSKRQKRAAKKAEEDFLYKVIQYFYLAIRAFKLCTASEGPHSIQLLNKLKDLCVL